MKEFLTEWKLPRGKTIVSDEGQISKSQEKYLTLMYKKTRGN